MKYFEVRVALSEQGFLVSPRALDEDFNIKTPLRGSAHVICARLLGLSYLNYLRFCVGLGAKIKTTNKTYPIAIFKDDKTARELAKVLDKRVEILTQERKDKMMIEDKIEELKTSIKEIEA